MTNLKKETLNILMAHNKTPQDIKWIGCKKFKISPESFWKLADVEYDQSYGITKVAMDLVIVGDNWWLERQEYDGYEWWEFKTIPIMPKRNKKINTLIPKFPDTMLEDLAKEREYNE